MFLSIISIVDECRKKWRGGQQPTGNDYRETRPTLEEEDFRRPQWWWRVGPGSEYLKANITIVLLTYGGDIEGTFGVVPGPLGTSVGLVRVRTAKTCGIARFS